MQALSLTLFPKGDSLGERGWGGGLREERAQSVWEVGKEVAGSEGHKEKITRYCIHFNNYPAKSCGISPDT